MDYKRLIKSKSFRIHILSLLNWIPNSIMIALQYKIHTGRRLNMKSPKRFTEKIQKYKLVHNIPQMLKCTDKNEVREYIKKQGFEKLLIPLIGLYDSPNEIDFETLPNSFVVKTTDGGGGNQIFICRDKNIISEKILKDKLLSWLKEPKPSKHIGREWAYENDFPRRIIIEEFLSDGVHKDIPDYKLWCFNGTPVYCQVIGNRSEKETIDFFDMDWNHQPFRGLNKACNNAINPIPCPEKFDEMKEIAKKLSKAFPFVRVDLYQANGKVYFGELTFYPASGYGHFTPDEWDEKIGTLFKI